MSSERVSLSLLSVLAQRRALPISISCVRHTLPCGYDLGAWWRFITVACGTWALTPAAFHLAGYHNMCRWNFMSLMQHPKIRTLDYYCRMDTDSRIRAKVRLLRALCPTLMSTLCAAGGPHRHLSLTDM